MKLNVNMDAHLEDEKRHESFDPITASLGPCLQTIILPTLPHRLRPSLCLTSFHVLNLSGSHAFPLPSTLHTGSSLLQWSSRRRNLSHHRLLLSEAAMEGSLSSPWSVLTLDILLRSAFPPLLSTEAHSKIKGPLFVHRLLENCSLHED